MGHVTSQVLPLLLLVAMAFSASFSDAARLAFEAEPESDEDNNAVSNEGRDLDIDLLSAACDKHACADQSTCCSSSLGESTCCPLKNAVCCSDGVHCCPAGTSCNLERKSCDLVVSSNVTRPAVRKQQPASDVTSPPSPDNMVCPDRSQCALPGAACCRQYTGRYGCCNYPLNVCCDDGVHCCGVGTVCDQLRLLCIPYPSAGLHQHWTELTKAARTATDVLLPDRA